MANNFLKAMQVLEGESPVKIILKSLGGCIFNRMAIFDAIHRSPCHLTATLFGAAMSIGAVILANGRQARDAATRALDDP